jgi:UDP-N-acetylglucosamine 2-epimerase
MSKAFFEEFSLPEPYINLNVGSGSHVYQTAEILLRLEKVMFGLKPDLVLTPGDTNSALASALTSVKIGIPLAHIESGARSYDMSMAEEINRRIVDHISQVLFTVSRTCSNNLKKESVTGKIFLSGDTMYDVYLHEIKKIQKSKILDELKLDDEYCVLTLHRAENVDDQNKLEEILWGITKTLDQKIVFPVHPRTRITLRIKKIEDNKLIIIDPLPYHDMMKLIQKSMLVLTDSGGLQKEAFWSKIPCITIRDRTEWKETVRLGVNFISGTKKETISQTIRRVLKNFYKVKERFGNAKNPYGDGNASQKIVDYLVNTKCINLTG